MKTLKLSTTLGILFLLSDLSFAQNKNLPSKLPTKKTPAQVSAPNPTARVAPQPVTVPPPGTNTPAPPPRAQAKPTAGRPTLPQGKSIRMLFKQPEWNLNPNELDSGSIVVRNVETSTFVQVELVENSPESAEFAGQYTFTMGSGSIIPEIYVLDQKSVRDGHGIQNMDQMIRDGLIHRKPLLIYTDKFGRKTMQVFNSAEDALSAKEKIDRDVLAARMARQPKPLVNESGLDTIAAQQKLQDRIREENAAKLKNAQRALELQKAEKEVTELLAKHAQLSPEEKEKRRRQGKEYADTGMDFFRINQFQQAESNFKKAYQSDPENRSYFYQYGVCLFKTSKYNQSLVYLWLATGPGVPRYEKEYYIALNFFKLKDYANARVSFGIVKATREKPINISAEFYNSIIEFENQSFDTAYNGFQKVLDESEDPKMDQAAEDYIEQINKIRWYLAHKAKKFFITMSAGPEYDSNLLLQSDVSSNQQTSNKGSSRMNWSGSFEYRPLFSDANEFSLKLSTDGQYTFSNDLASADTFSYMTSAVYKYKGMLFGKGYKLEVSPGYLMVYNDPTTIGTKKLILNSIPISVSNMFVMSETWISNYNFSYSMDTSKLDITTTDDDASATKFVAGLNNIFFTNKKQSHAWILDFKYTKNMATGKNIRFTKLEPSVGYLMPVFWEMTMLPKLTYYSLNYPEKSTVRTDTDVKVSTNFTKPLLDWLALTLDLAYITNSSTIPESYEYKKYVGTLLLNANYSF